MINMCTVCGVMRTFVYDRAFIGPDGRQWEVYRCIKCMHAIGFAVG